MIICPGKGQTGRELRLEEVVDELDADGYPIFKLIAPSGTFRWSWSDPSSFKRLLNDSGYSNLDEKEINRLNHVLYHSIVGSVLEGQGREINVIKATVDYRPSFDRKLPPNKWMEPTGLPSCGSSER